MIEYLLREILVELREIRRELAEPAKVPSREELETAARITYETAMRAHREQQMIDRLPRPNVEQ